MGVIQTRGVSAMRLIVYPYKLESKGAVKIQDFLTDAGEYCLRVHPNGDYKPHRNDLVIGWGAGDWPDWRNAADQVRAKWLNKSDKICLAIDKLLAFEKFKTARVPIPKFTTNIDTARSYLRADGQVVIRKEVEGRDGSGMVIATSAAQVVEAPLYTSYIKKTEEYRIHIFDGAVICAQVREKRDSFTGRVNYQVRTTSGGWGLSITTRQPPECNTAAIAAVKALGLDFGAVDVIWNRVHGAFVLEVNSAPELTAAIAVKYGERILQRIRS
jgi:glutathione synthase/RimK-type ligase-like ATP-grasp enzyme